MTKAGRPSTGTLNTETNLTKAETAFNKQKQSDQQHKIGNSVTTYLQAEISFQMRVHIRGCSYEFETILN